MPRWNVSVMSIFETQTGPSSGYASQITWRMRRNAIPNCIDSGAISLSVVSLKLGVSLSGGADKFRIRRGRRWACGTATMWESFNFSLNNHKVSSADRGMLNPSCIRRHSSPQIKLTMSGAHADACGPLWIASSKALLDHSRPVVKGMPSSK